MVCYNPVVTAPWLHPKSFFKDKSGKIVVWQNLNLPIILWAGATLMSKLIKTGSLHSLFSIIAFGWVFTWAWLEITQGASPFRRMLGAIVMILSIRSRL
jgi:hypothetical protein